MTGLLPDEVLSRPKQGFGTPMEEWMRGDFGARTQEEIRRSSLADRGLLDYERVDELFAAENPDAAAAQKAIAFSDEIQVEDIKICENVQKGLHSRTYDHGRFSVKRENGVHHFHLLLHEFLTG